MPEPVYIICSESGAEDKNTGLMSLFNILEKIQVVKVTPETPVAFLPRPLTVQATAAWGRVAGDASDQLFDFQFLFTTPGLTLAQGAGQFSFGDKPLYRTIGRADLLQFPGPGTLSVVCRVKRAGSEGPWQEQRYKILIEEVSPPPTAGLERTTPCP
jgi:hypothetical protein